MGKTRKNMYWGMKEEDAIRDFIISEDESLRHQLFTDVIQPAFSKLSENIFFTYNFNRTLPDFPYTQHELMIHLYDKIDRFDPEKGKKAYSYFGTVSKNWLIQQSTKTKRLVHIDDENKEVIMNGTSIDIHKQKKVDDNLKDFIDFLIDRFSEIKSHPDFNDDDISVIAIVVDILKNYEILDIYNKKELYVYIKNATDLPARKITRAIGKLRFLYVETKREHIE